MLSMKYCVDGKWRRVAVSVCCQKATAYFRPHYSANLLRYFQQVPEKRKPSDHCEPCGVLFLLHKLENKNNTFSQQIQLDMHLRSGMVFLKNRAHFTELIQLCLMQHTYHTVILYTNMEIYGFCLCLAKTKTYKTYFKV